MPVLQPGNTCWRLARASRVSVLIDTAAYYLALREAALSAQRSLLIVGWDVDSRTPLVPEAAPADGFPPLLLDFLNALLARRPALHVHVLAWDFSMIYAIERESLTSLKFGWKSHGRLHFALDDHHPQGASQHQKLVVVDDRVAFCGGMDLTIRRWDTPEHRPEDARRIDPQGTAYAPMHDVQLALEGDAAAALGELARARWAAATGEQLSPPAARAPGRARFWRRSRRQGPLLADVDPWPGSAQVDFRDIDVGIVRTQHALDADQPNVREALEFTLAAIASARRSVLIENQYLTAAAVGAALAHRLAEPDGPEIVAILPKVECGWMEQSSMGMLRARMLQKLARADRHGHLHVCYPQVPDLGEACLNVHSKVLIVDDRLLKVGSSNLSNRSLSLDAECDIAIEASEQQPELRHGIAAITCRLLGEHLGLSPVDVDARLRALGSIAALIEERRDQPRCLQPLVDAGEAPVNLALLDGILADPERPIDASAFMERLVPEEFRRPTWRSLYGVVSVVGAVVLLTSAWRFTPLSQFASAEQVADLVRELRADALAPLYVWLVYVLGAGVFFPITLLIAGTALAFDPLRAFVLSMCGALSSAVLSYFIGRAMGRFALRRFTGARLRKLSAPIKKRAFRTIVTARILPLGNFTAINLLAGALRVPFRAYVLGNVVGLLPGIIGLSLLTDRLVSAFQRPTVLNVSVLMLCLCVLGWGLWQLKRALDRQARSGPERLALATERSALE